MAATTEQKARLVRMTALDTGVYDAAMQAAYIERYPLVDDDGHDPVAEADITDDTEWTPTYDLNSAAADIWEEKAATFAECHDTQADGSAYTLSQKFRHANKQARVFRSRRSPRCIKHRTQPRNTTFVDEPETQT